MERRGEGRGDVGWAVGRELLPRRLNMFILLLSKDNLEWLRTKDIYNEINKMGIDKEIY